MKRDRNAHNEAKKTLSPIDCLEASSPGRVFVSY